MLEVYGSSLLLTKVKVAPLSGVDLDIWLVQVFLVMKLESCSSGWNWILFSLEYNEVPSSEF